MEDNFFGAYLFFVKPFLQAEEVDPIPYGSLRRFIRRKLRVTNFTGVHLYQAQAYSMCHDSAEANL